MRYKCEQRLVVTSNVRLRLTREQLRRREGQVHQVSQGIFSPIREVEFKAGEFIEVDGDLPKMLRSQVSVLGSAGAPQVAPAPAPEGEEGGAPRRRRSRGE